MIDRAPQIVSLSTDLHKDLVKMTLPLRRLPHSFRSTFPDLVCEAGAETVYPVADSFVTDIDTTLVK